MSSDFAMTVPFQLAVAMPAGIPADGRAIPRALGAVTAPTGCSDCTETPSGRVPREVADHPVQLVGRGDVDVLDVGQRLGGVPGRPVEGLPALEVLGSVLRVHPQPPGDHVAPVRARAEVAR